MKRNNIAILVTLFLIPAFLFRFSIPWILAILFMFVLLATGVIIALIDTIHFVKDPSKNRPFVLMWLFVIIFITVEFKFNIKVGAYTKLYLNYSDYEVTLNKIKNNEPNACTYPCIIDKGPPLRIAFIWGGFADNWFGACYDRTSLVLKVNEQYTDNRDATGLFGGNLVYSYHLRDNWYYCAFS